MLTKTPDLADLHLEPFIEKVEELLTFNADATTNEKIDAIASVLLAVVKREALGDVV